MLLRSLILVSTFAANTALADTSAMSYNYISMGYLDGQLEDTDLSGFGLSGKFAVSDLVFVQAGYSTSEFDSNDAELDNITLGFGVHTPINSSVDFVTSAAYSEYTFDFNDPSSITSDGYNIDAGLRARVNTQLELNASVNRLVLNDHGENGWGAGARVYLDDQASLGLNHSSVDEFDTLTVDIRFDL